MSRASRKHLDVAGETCPTEGTLTDFINAVTDDAITRQIKQHLEDCQRCQETLEALILESDPLGAKLRQAGRLEPDFFETTRRVDAILERARRDSVDGGNDDSPDGDATSFRPEDELIVTTQLTIDEFCSEGGLGQVWKSTDDFGRTLALKVIKPSRVRDPLVRRRFLREARLTATLTHPSIVTVHGAGTNERDEPFYVMSFVDGVTLDSVVRERSKTTVQLLQSYIDVCNAIQYAHEKGVIHRDIKPSNILLGTHGETTVVDWGLARRIDEASPASNDPALAEPTPAERQMTEHGSRVGTPEYMSPEQASGVSEVAIGPSSDVYSLGATLYAILTGKAPFEGRDTREIYEKVRQGDFAPPSHIAPTTPRALEAVCLKAMAVLPRARYQSAAELRQEIDRWLEDRPVTAYAEPFSVKVGRWLKRHRTLASVSLATALVAAIALGVELTRATAANNDLKQLNDELEVRLQQLAEAQQRVAGQLYQQGEMLNSLKEYSVALQLREQQFAADPSEARRFALVAAWNGVALTQHKSAQLRLATESYKVALEHLQQLLALAPQNADYLTMRIRILGNRGMTDRVLYGPETAAQTYVEAIDTEEELIRIAGSTSERKREAARLNGNLADALSETDDKERELKHRKWALGLLKELVVTDRQDGLEEFIGVHAVRLTTTLLRLQREEEALRELRDIISYFDLIEAGEKHNWGQQFEAAECLTFLSQHEPDRFKSDALAVRAVAVLREMRKRGFFRSQPQLVERLESASRLDKLRERTDFQELLTELLSSRDSQRQ